MHRLASILALAVAPMALVASHNAAAKDGSSISPQAYTDACTLASQTFKASRNTRSFDQVDVWSHIPQTSVTFVQGGSDPGCVIDQFAAEGRTDHNYQRFIRAKVDAGNCAQRDVLFYPGNTIDNTNSFAWVCVNVPPGDRRVRIYWMITASSGPGQIFVQETTTIVQYQ